MLERTVQFPFLYFYFDRRHSSTREVSFFLTEEKVTAPVQRRFLRLCFAQELNLNVIIVVYTVLETHLLYRTLVYFFVCILFKGCYKVNG